MLKESKNSKILTTITSIYLALLMSVFLLYTGSSGYERIAEAKFNIFLMICGGYIIIMLLLMLEMLLVGGFHSFSIRQFILNTTWIERLAFIYIIITWISALVSPYFLETVIGATRNEGALTITIYVLTFLLVSSFGKIEKWMPAVLSVIVCVFCFICILQIHGFNPLELYPEGYNYFGANVDYSGAYLGTIGNVDSVAAFLCIAIPVFLVSLIRLNDKRKWFLLLPLVMSFYVLIRMGVLAGLVGVFTGCLFSLAVVLPVRKSTKKLIGVILICCVVLALIVVALVDIGSGMFHEIHLLLHGQTSDSFGSGRFYIWRSVLERVPRQLWLGSGPDTMYLCGIDPFERLDESKNMLIVAEIDLAHNEYLNVLFHQGIFAVAVFLGILLVAAKKWFLVSHSSVSMSVFGSALLCYCIQAFFGFSLCMVAPYFWTALAFVNNAKNCVRIGGKGNVKAIA